MERSTTRAWITAGLIAVLAVIAAAALAPGDVGFTDDDELTLEAPIRILDTRFGIGGPPIGMGARNSRVIDLGDVPELVDVVIDRLKTRVAVIPNESTSTVIMSSSADKPIEIPNGSDRLRETIELAIGVDQLLTISVAGEPIDLVVEVVGLRQVNDEG